MGRPAHAGAPRVPTTRDVVAGVGVHIVLKKDQPTGRTVTGVVRDVLTRGDHPRGIKVRLADGRIGRVQSLASVTAAAAGAGESAPTAETDTGFATGDSLLEEIREDRDARRRRLLGRNWQGEEGSSQAIPSEQIGLDAYMRPAKQKGKRRGKHGRGVASISPETEEFDDDGGASLLSTADTSAVARCPVCGEFEGDEAAVAHHVSGHFDS